MWRRRDRCNITPVPRRPRIPCFSCLIQLCCSRVSLLRTYLSISTILQVVDAVRICNDTPITYSARRQPSAVISSKVNYLFENSTGSRFLSASGMTEIRCPRDKSMYENGKRDIVICGFARCTGQRSTQSDNSALQQTPVTNLLAVRPLMYNNPTSHSALLPRNFPSGFTVVEKTLGHKNRLVRLYNFGPNTSASPPCSADFLHQTLAHDDVATEDALKYC